MALEDIEKLKEKVKKDPNSKLFVPLAEEYRKTGMLDEAISVLMTGITGQPGYASARVSLGKIYLEKKMAPAAKEEFEKVISAIPENLFAHKKLAEIYRDSGEKERAIGEYRVVLKLNPLDDDAVSNLETLQRGHMQEESITVTESAPEEFTVQGNEAVEPSPDLLREETIRAEEVEVLPAEEPLQPQHGDEFEEFKRSMAGQGEAASATKAEDGTQPEDVFGEEVISDEDMEEAEKEVMSYAAAFGEQDTAQPPSSFEALKEEKAPVAERLPEKEDKGRYSPKDAELFISEGNYLKAMSIYREMLSANPQDKYVMQKVEELRMLLKMLGKDKEAVIDKLETFGERVKEWEKKNEFFRSS
jgi:tetratricopeptide (TPR) repeat protein